jgi:hypothetical protein
MASESALERLRRQSPNELIDNAGFRWSVATGGYRWVDQQAVYPARARRGDMIPDRVLVPVGDDWSRQVEYDPLAEAALFMTFADTPPDEDGLLGFANRFGYLRARHSDQIFLGWIGGWSDPWTSPAELQVPEARGRAVIPVERYWTWRQEVIAVKDCLDLWRTYIGGDRAAVARHLRHTLFGPGSVLCDPPKGTPPAAMGGDRLAADVQMHWLRCLCLCADLLLPEADRQSFSATLDADLGELRFPGWETEPVTREPGSAREKQQAERMKRLRAILGSAPEPVLAVAQHLVYRRIDDKLRGQTTACVNWDSRRRGPVMGLAPQSLVGAMWLQFAQEVTGNARHRPCKLCGKWLTISRDDYGFRSDREFCSAACRQKDYRGKVKEARRLRAEGRTVRQIAKHFATTTETVTHWLTMRI